MPATVDPNLRLAAAHAESHRNMIENLTAPFAAGAVDSALDVDSTGTVTVSDTTRHPLVVVAAAKPLEAERLILEATVPGPTAGSTVAVGFEFAPYTEAGSFLPLYLPPLSDPATGTAQPFSVSLKLKELVPGGTPVAVQAAELKTRLLLRLIEGIMGRAIFLLGAEKQRLRRQARELAAMRSLSRARDDALDQLGAELSVPRFADRLTFVNNEVTSTVAREPDDDYRRRLALYRPLLLRNRPQLLELLNGPGPDTDPNKGPIAELAARMPQPSAYRKRFELIEADNPIALGIHLIGAGSPAYRDNFLEFVRAVHLIWPSASAEAEKVHKARFLPEERADREQRLRKSLGALYTFKDFEPKSLEPAFAPMLAAALVRAGRCMKALGLTMPWPIFRGQSEADGSRYELGLGADVKRLTAPELNAMKAQHETLAQQSPPFKDVADPDPSDPKARPELIGLLDELTPRTSAVDPDGAWLLEPCGLRTIHRAPKPQSAPWSVTYVSHFPVFGMKITGPEHVALGGITLLAPTVLGATVVAYRRDTGDARKWYLDSKGKVQNATAGLGNVGTDWTHIVAADYDGDGGLDDLLFYDRINGKARVCVRLGNGFSPGATITGLPKHCSHVVWIAYPLGFLFYQRASGEAHFYAPATTGDALTLKRKLTGWRKSWTHIVRLQREQESGSELQGSGSVELFLYDARANEGVSLSVRGTGEVRHGTHRRFDRSWSHVVPGYFEPPPVNGGQGNTGEAEGGDTDGQGLPSGKLQGLLFFDRASNDIEVYDETWRLVNRETGPPGNWTDLAPAVSDPAAGFTELFFYNRVTGRLIFGYADRYGTVSSVEVASNLPKAGAHKIEVRYHAPGDPGGNVVLTQGLASALTAWTDAGGAAWTELSHTAAVDGWDDVDPLAATDPPLVVFDKAGLPAVEDPAPVVARLKSLRPELLATLMLDSNQAKAIIQGQSGADDDLRELANLFRDQRLTSLLPLVTSKNEVLLVVGVVPLPVAGLNLFEQPSTGFRWYAVPIQGMAGKVRPLGGATEYTPTEEGLCALVVLGYARRGLTDPYEYRVELPEGGLLTLEQYEFVMNLLDHTHPAGVRVNTWSVRREHVDLKGDGKAYPLDPTISRTYRAFKRSRHRGQTSVTLED